MDKKDFVKAYSAAALFSMLIGFSFLGIKMCIPYADTLLVLVHRYNFALIAVLLLVVFRVVKIELRGKPKKNLFLTAGFYIAFMLFQVAGLYFATSIEGSIIFAAVPIMVQLIAAVFLKEKPTWLQAIFIVCTVAALIVMVVLGSTNISFNPLGMILLFIASIFSALSNVYMRYVRGQYKPIEISTAIVVGGTIVFNVLYFISRIATHSEISYFAPLHHIQFVIAACYLGVGCILLSAQTMSYLQSKLQAAKASIFGNVSTAISIVAGVVILGEPLFWYHIVCSAIIVACAIGLNFSGNKGGKHEVRISNGK